MSFQCIQVTWRLAYVALLYNCSQKNGLQLNCYLESSEPHVTLEVISVRDIQLEFHGSVSVKILLLFFCSFQCGRFRRFVTLHKHIKPRSPPPETRTTIAGR